MSIGEVNEATSHDAIKDMLLDDDQLRWHLAFVENGGKLQLYRHWVRGASGVGGKGLLYTDCYSKTHSFLRFLVSVAKTVNPKVTDDEIEHHIINNSTHKGMMTCEFPCPRKPKGWTEIDSLPTAH